MRMYPRIFPAIRAAMPERGAERRIYEGTGPRASREGFAYYEWRRGYGRIEVDFAVWIEDVGRFALQVKGGHYLLIDGEWHLRTRRGLKAVDASPLDEAWLGALDLHDDIAELAETARTTPSSRRRWSSPTWSPMGTWRTWPEAQGGASAVGRR